MSSADEVSRLTASVAEQLRIDHSHQFQKPIFTKGLQSGEMRLIKLGLQHSSIVNFILKLPN